MISDVLTFLVLNHFENFALAIEKFFKTEYELDINVSLISLDQLTREEFIRCTMTPSFTSFASWFSGLAYLSLGPSTFFEGFLNKTNVNCLNLSKFDEKIFCDYIANPCFKKLYETFSKKSKNHLPEFSDFSFEPNPMFFPYSETYCEMGTLASFEVSFKGMKKDRVYTMDIFFNKVLLDNLEENGLLFEGIKNRFIPLEKPLGNFVVELGRCYLDDNCVLSKNNYLQYSSTTWVKNCFGITNNNVFWLYIENGTTSLADLRTWLSTHNTIVYYVLATATDTQITNTTLINQLEALEDANSYDTQTNITQTNADLPFIITATAIRSLVDIFNGGA